MSINFITVRAAVFAMLCLVLSACSQTAVSSYNGKLGNSAASVEEIRKKKILAARERARAIKAQRKAAFKAKRAKRAERRKARAEKRKASRTTKKTRAKTRKTAKKINVAKKKKSRKVAGKVVTRSKKKTLKSKKAFVPNVSRRAGKLKINAPWKCVPSRLKRVIADVRKRYGRVTINSTYRSSSRNRMVGGKKRSYHLRCAAVDFRVHGSTRGLTRYLARHKLVGGYKRYRSGFYHIDTGPKRTW